jgi:Gly-Xaa carboxypeptidase
MNVEKVNKLGLLYTLQGSSKTLKPIVFMAHTDVVPVPDPTRWTHPPFEAFFDGRWLFGRGTADCKTDLVAIFSTMERLLEQDLKNNRTIILSFGFDETTGGVRGAKQLAAHLEERYGEKSMALIIVPGGGGMRTVGDVAYALPAVAEKGSLDIVLTLTTPGGHSAAPPPHTGIGIMSRLVTAVEDQAFTPHVYENNPILDYLKCEVEYSPKTAEPWLREALERGDDFADRIVESRGEPFRWLMQTSKSIDKMHGGIKDNQLPELTEAVINYGVLPSEKIEHVLKAAADLLVPIANQYNIAVNGPGYSQIDRGAGMLNISSANILQPSPITPTGQNIGVWNMLGGTIRQVFEHTRDEFSASKVIPVGILTLGNTDTAHYWRLSDNIYRFSPRWQGTSANVHTVDEKIDMQAHSGELQFYYELIRNMDGYTAE